MVRGDLFVFSFLLFVFCDIFTFGLVSHQEKDLQPIKSLNKKTVYLFPVSEKYSTNQFFK